MTNRLRQSGKELKEHPDIIVRKADKANIYVIMDRSEYNEKLLTIILDDTKFK